MLEVPGSTPGHGTLGTPWHSPRDGTLGTLPNMALSALHGSLPEMALLAPHGTFPDMALLALHGTLPAMALTGMDSVGKADLLSDHFDSKQSWEAVGCRSQVIRLLVLSSYHICLQVEREVMCLLLDLDPNGGTDPLGMFPLFLIELQMLWNPVIV